ncbi:MAG: acyl carrier protein [Oscillospiraceae bacterium]|nr:acyl carrier protein [Oscillospiraceae bacterium]
MSAAAEILSRLFPDLDIANCDRLIDDGLLDSFSIITLVTELANDHSIKIPATEIIPENFNSLTAIESLIDKLINQS